MFDARWGRWIEDMRQKYFVGSRPDRSDGWDGRIILVPKGKVRAFPPILSTRKRAEDATARGLS